MDKEDVACIHNGILRSHEKEGSLAICGLVGGPRGHHTKGKHARETPYDATHMRSINKRQKRDSLQNGNRLTDTESKRTVTKGEKEGGTG